MKILRLCTTILFLLVLCAFVVFNLRQLRMDKTYPEITIDGEVLEVSLTADRAELMTGVTAYDEKDGDITDKVIIESISRFTEKGVSIVRYAVCDNDDHAVSAQRKIRYKDYESPRFTLSSSLVFSMSENIYIRYILGAEDSIDGDISRKVIITASDYNAQSNGVYYISAKVTNSKGDKISIQLPIYIEEKSLSAPRIELESYLTYLHVGEEIDLSGNVLSAVDSDGTDIRERVQIDTDFDPAHPGQYEAHYRCTDALGRTGHEILTIIVEE